MSDRRVLGLVLVMALAAAASVVAARSQRQFPHEQHARLFPVCVGCHAGIPSGDGEAVYPEPQACVRCHDGERVARVEWSRPSPRVSNLRFDHVAHARRIDAAGSIELDCAECHNTAGAPRMRVEPPIPDRCFACHAHAATEHVVDGACTTCHVPLVESGFPVARIAALPVPTTHLADDFLAAAHGADAAAAPQSCATCHAREQCMGCHVSVVAASPVERIPSALERIEVPAIPARYPVPDSHLDESWETQHGAAASAAACGTCHTRESCAGCHTTAALPVIAQLAGRAEAAAPGAAVARRPPASHASAFFATAHGPLAGTRPQSCATCHDRSRFCGACHEPATSSTEQVPAGGAAGSAVVKAPYPRILEYRHASEVGPARAAAGADTASSRTAVRGARTAEVTPAPRERRGFHPPNYVVRHPAEAFGRRLDCTTCHSTQLFCRDCHENAGLGSIGRLGPGYHDAEPLWLLRHGQAARQTLESCTSCHTQRDCMQCHSQLGAFRVNPHGPGFDARRAQRTNPQICRACHLTDPLGGG